ncbi:MAG TPA: Uma2 family endonuclease [Woeseiaceae bacterium]|nr:Uma2 family endonuclease [Woeseiaceae bacterium]
MGTPMESWPRRHRITVDEYYRMAEVGLLAPDARVELIEGEIIDMPPIGPDHGSVVDMLNHLLVHAVGDRAIVRVQGAVRLSQASEPQPDVALLVPRTDYYREGHPSGATTFLVIEVSDSTLRYDCDVKVPLYARHGVPEVWIVDIRSARILCWRLPAGGAYRDEAAIAEPGETPITALPGVSVNLSRLLR